MDPDSGKLYDSRDAALQAGIKNAIEMIGAPEDIQRVSEAVSAQYKAKKKAKRKAQTQGRRNNRA